MASVPEYTALRLSNIYKFNSYIWMGSELAGSW